MIGPRLLASLTVLVFAGVMAAGARAEGTIGYEAEHVIEALMDARYLALPSIPENTAQGQSRLQTGINRVSAGSFDAAALMLGLEYFMPTAERGGYLFSLFGDFQHYSANSGAAVFDPAFVTAPPFPVPLPVNVTGVEGHAEHYGLSAARVAELGPTRAWQYGLVLEYFDVARFAVSFDSVGLADNFSAVVDYANSYLAVTPYVALRQRFPVRRSRLKYSARLLLAWPLPRQGFYGHLSYPGFEQAGTGEGKHIPDTFAGLGFTLAGPQQEWRIDIGASLYYFLAEGRIHKGVTQPLFLNISWRL